MKPSAHAQLPATTAPLRVKAVPAPSWQARVTRSTALYYRDGPDDRLDRPSHVRAASSLSWVAGRLAVVQDDANFVALIDLHDESVEAIELPVGLAGMRLFDDLRGNKWAKLDLEACVTVPEGDGHLLVAFGSGSSPLREHVITINWTSSVPDTVRLFAAPAFYAALRSTVEFAGSELNIEGAVYLGNDRVRLFQRGNGAPRGGVLPVDATCDLSWSQLRSHLYDPATTPPPAPTNTVAYDLGMLDGVRLTFTDAALSHGTVFFTAAAEASPDAQRDGVVVGSVIGRIAGSDIRWAVLQGPDDQRFAGKVEGLCMSPTDPSRGWLLVDRDDPCMASELCEMELSGDWAGGDAEPSMRR